MEVVAMLSSNRALPSPQALLYCPTILQSQSELSACPSDKGMYQAAAIAYIADCCVPELLRMPCCVCDTGVYTSPSKAARRNRQKDLLQANISEQHQLMIAAQQAQQAQDLSSVSRPASGTYLKHS